MSTGKYLIVGRGISGSILSFRLMERGISHDILDDSSLSQSSRIAAGLINPIVLKRLKLVQDASLFMPSAEQFYRDWEQKLRVKFLHQVPIEHLFNSYGEVNQWHEKSDLLGFQAYFGKVHSLNHPHIRAPFGSGILNGGGWLDTLSMLDAHLSHFSSQGQLLNLEATAGRLKELAADYSRIILCNGHMMRFIVPELSEAYTPTRGEVLIIHAPDLPAESILHASVFILPLGNQEFKVGATYHWDYLEDIHTEDGLGKLRTGLEKIYTGPYTILSHQGGVRPNIKDRKPLLGPLNQAGYFSFNGMGSRAALMAPYLADIFLDHLLHEKPLPEIYQVQRFL